MIHQGTTAFLGAAPAFAEVLAGVDWDRTFETPIHRQITWARAVRRGTHVRACPRVKMRNVHNLIPSYYYGDNLEFNQKVASCCRHPENHDIEAFYSSPQWRDKLRPDGIYPELHPNAGQPNIYIFHCHCGRKHHRFMVGLDAYRPFWGRGETCSTPS